MIISCSHPAVKIVQDGSADSYFLNAAQYRIAFITIAEAHDGTFRAPVFRPLYHLAGQCIELVLKAFIINAGSDPKIFKGPIGHDLAKLLKMTSDLGLQVDDVGRDQIILMSPAIFANFFRYGIDRRQANPLTRIPIPDIDILRTAIDKLMMRVGDALDIPFYVPTETDLT